MRVVPQTPAVKEETCTPESRVMCHCWFHGSSAMLEAVLNLQTTAPLVGEDPKLEP